MSGWNTLATARVGLTFFNDQKLIKAISIVFKYNKDINVKDAIELFKSICKDIKIEDWARGTEVDYLQILLTYFKEHPITYDVRYPEYYIEKFEKEYNSRLSNKKLESISTDTSKEILLMEQININIRTFYNDMDLSDKTDSEIVEMIARIESQIEQLQKLKTQSKRVSSQITSLQETNQKLADYLDNR